MTDVGVAGREDVMAGAAIMAEGLCKRFGQVAALDGVDLELPAGGVLGVLGPNGAGKTTLVRIFATLVRPERGRALVAGFDVAQHPAQVRRRIGLSGQYAAVDPFLTGRENLIMIGRLYGLSRRQARRRADDLTGRLELDGAAGRLVRTYSGGMRRRLDVAASLLAAPLVLFLDEPTTGLDPRGRLAVWQMLGGLTAGGTSVLLTTQYIEEAERLASTVVIVDHGTVIASGTPGQLRDRAGGDRLEVQSPPGQDTRQLAGALAALGTGEPVVDDLAGQVILPVADGPGILPAVAGRLAAAGLRVSGLALRRPTLEEAFLAFTGEPRSPAHPSQREAGGSSPATRPPAHPARNPP
jgi:daunorubicin resistance ABC transporter ATP-binding subunit